MIKDNLEYLIKAATNSPHSDSILTALKQFKKYSGDFFDDDKSYECRMALFLEWYIFDYINPTTKKTVLESIINGSKEIPLDIAKSISLFVFNIHALFIVKKINKHSVRIVNLFDGKIYEVVETSGKFCFSKNNIFEGRLLSHKNTFYFTGNFCFHPDDSKNFIKKELKKVLAIEHLNKKKIEACNKKLSDETKKLNKTIEKIKKIKLKIQQSKFEKKGLKLKESLSKVESIKVFYEQVCSSLSNETATLSNQKIIREKKTNQSLLMFKLSSMKLLFDRSHNIKVNDIYKN